MAATIFAIEIYWNLSWMILTHFRLLNLGQRVIAKKVLLYLFLSLQESTRYPHEKKPAGVLILNNICEETKTRTDTGINNNN